MGPKTRQHTRLDPSTNPQHVTRVLYRRIRWRVRIPTFRHSVYNIFASSFGNAVVVLLFACCSPSPYDSYGLIDFVAIEEEEASTIEDYL